MLRQEKKIILENETYPSANNHGGANQLTPTATPITGHEPNKNETRSYNKPDFWLLLGAFLAASTAAYYTRQQWITADDQEVRSLRAYLTIAGGESANGTLNIRLQTFAIGAPIIGLIAVRNDGQTPAQDVRVEMVVTTMPRQLTLSYDFSAPRDYRSATIGPHDTVFPSRQSDFILTDGQYNRIMSGDGNCSAPSL